MSFKIKFGEKRACSAGIVFTAIKEKIIKKMTNKLFLLTKNAMRATNSASNEPLDIVKKVAMSVPKRQTKSMILRCKLFSSLNWCSDKRMAKIVTKPIRSIFIMWENPNRVDIGVFIIK